MRYPRFTSVALALSGALLLGACSESPVTAPNAVRSISAKPLNNVVQSKVRTLTVCAAGPIGTYGYSLSFTSSSLNTVNLPFGNSFTLSNDECKDVVTLSQGAGFTFGDADPITEITVSQVSMPANTILDYLIKTEETDQAACTPGNVPCGTDVQESGPTTTVGINFYHGSVVSYWNEEHIVNPPTTGCTLTQGYWKNHTSAWPAGYDPNAPFFNSGKSWIQVLNTPPKGSAYLILAHQYIAATLNIASGASMPPDVQTAYDDATNYFQNGVGGDLTGWANILDNYNNGLAAGGPAHCN